MNQTEHTESVKAKQSAARRAARADKPAAKKAKPNAKAPSKAQPRVGGETVRKLMADLGLSGKELATAGGFSASRVAELRQVGELPASWKGRDRHATTTQWAAVEKAARALAAKRGKSKR